MKKRQYLPLMAKLNFSIDIERLRNEFFEFGYDNFNMYNGLSYENNTEDGLIVRRVLLEYFLTDAEKKEREGKLVANGGEAYKMLCLTEFNGDPEKYNKNLAKQLKESGMDPRKFAKRMEKICDPKNPLYSPIADEKLYDKRNDYCKGYVSEILDLLEKNIGHVARSRYAVLKAGEKIKPHLDINTDKAIRIHIPLITHPDVITGVKGKNRKLEMHLPADGSVWFLNQAYQHWVDNNSSVDRVHLVCAVIGQNSIQDSNYKFIDENLLETVAA